MRRSKYGACEHCGAVWDAAHAEGRCGVAEATRFILAGYQPRGATAGFECPKGHGDGVWHWWPNGGAGGFECEVCGVVVDTRTGAALSEVEREAALEKSRKWREAEAAKRA